MLYKTVADSDAQQQFSQNDEALGKLDTSGEICDYIVSGADATTVNFHHRNDLQTRHCDLKKEVKKLRAEVAELTEMKNVADKNEITLRATLSQWQVATVLIEGLYTKIWFSLTKADREQLESQLQIYDVQTLFESRLTLDGKIETNRNHIANRVCSTISQEHRSALKELNDIKHCLRLNRTSLARVAHPHVFVSDLNNFIKFINPSPILRSLLRELETMEVRRNGTMERLFDDSNTCC